MGCFLDPNQDLEFDPEDTDSVYVNDVDPDRYEVGLIHGVGPYVKDKHTDLVFSFEWEELVAQALDAGMSGSDVWSRCDERTYTTLLLVGGHCVPEQVVSTWSDKQCMEAEEWALSVHLSASDNDGIEVPPMPEHVAAYPEAC
ncbi:hypothetical protein CJ010_00645 [Azoarcus sp. DD4]|uniref:hypothetical protein n=1 Tax=Azoarcus sp. DD4 TaxID=2027405 RepID=UPI001129FB52|nr:hypothetical protein [Azoarcus sp. DD4]QDF95164.1 hypothetical protein CJ010_00645 [Azoarcus sp. DD4]